MARTANQVISRARSMLRDKVDPARYTAEDMLNAVNDALVEVRRVRPDLFLKNKFKIITVSDLDAALQVEDLVFNSLVYFVVGTMMLRDDEHTVDGRASALLNKATAQLVASAA